MSLKPDAEEFRQEVGWLSTQPWLAAGERKSWPRFLYHYTDVRNAASILDAGQLLSRAFVEREHLLAVSSGSQEILEQTASRVQDCVRLYFRPRTPTQWHSEGIWPSSHLRNSKYPTAHCPVPVFFLFDSAAVLSLCGTEFSDGNLGSGGSSRYRSASEFRSLPWKKIYHSGRFDPNQRDIVRKRCAEVIVPRRLSLEYLKLIVCRSEAEKETLFSLMPSRLVRKYRLRVTSTQKVDLFYRRRTYVRRVDKKSDWVTFWFSPDTQTRGPYELIVSLSTGDGSPRIHAESGFMVPKNGRWGLRFAPSLSSYSLCLTLDGHLAYAGTFEPI